MVCISRLSSQVYSKTDYFWVAYINKNLRVSAKIDYKLLLKEQVPVEYDPEEEKTNYR